MGSESGKLLGTLIYNYKCYIQVSHKLSIEEEIVLTVTNYINHPEFSIEEGPRAGHDISVYTVIEDPLRAAVESICISLYTI